LIRAGFVG
jgi:hypothetical protein